MNCKNCNTTLIDNKGYCHYCGARIIKNRLTFKNLFSQLNEEFLNYDNKLLKTLKHLLIKPEAVINGFIKGVRKKYINPVSFATIAIALSGIQVFILKKFFPEFMNDIGSIVPKKEDVPDFYTDFMSNFMDYQDVFLFIAIPIMAVLSYIVFWNLKQYNFVEHIILHFYAYSLTSIISIFLTLIIVFIPNTYGASSMAGISYLLMISYYIYVFKRVFNLSTKRIIKKTLVFLGIMMLLIILMILIAAIVTILLVHFGVIEPPQP